MCSFNCIFYTDFIGGIVPYELSAEYIIDKLLAYSIRDDNRKIPIDCGKCDVTILLT